MSTRRPPLSLLPLVFLFVEQGFVVAFSDDIVRRAASNSRRVVFVLFVKRCDVIVLLLLLLAFEFSVDCAVDDLLKFEIHFVAHFMLITPQDKRTVD